MPEAADQVLRMHQWCNDGARRVRVSDGLLSAYGCGGLMPYVLLLQGPTK